MEHYQRAIYKSTLWKQIRSEVLERDKGICYFCGKVINKKPTIHHKEELNEENYKDFDIAYGLDNLVSCHFDCHNQHHERFGYKSSIVNNDLSINYDKRESKFLGGVK